ncbi:restin homolog isoform X2 [Teleopsis dalmanni]|uniref:restin homolog isoform X2 n=1 Tax=Teleopsis dalmanni TaxID=139649 RepID=UPI0018CE9AED|nr:restin homolog isoform X2 [Teleopsis dalmanni]
MSRESDDNLSSINSTYTDLYQETVKRFTRSSLSPEMDRFSPSRMSTKSASTSQKSYHGAILTADTEQFIIGQKVWVGGIRPGQIAYIGETHFAPGDWAGVVLDEPNGKNDGCVAGKRYFQCEPKRGIFSRLTRLTLVPLASACVTPTSPLSKNSPERSRTVSPTASIRSSLLRSPSKNGLTVGDRVIVSSGFGSRPGILRYLGETQFAQGNWCGIELDEPTGKNDGSVDGIRYFECKPKYGIFVTIAKVSLSPSSKKTRLSRAGSRESLTSIGTMNSIATTNTSRMRMNAQRKSPSIKPISTPKSQFSMQDLLREKHNHIEQLLIERELDREEAQNQALQFQKNINELNLKINQLQLQLEDERKKSEELQFSIHEAQCYGDELNAETQVYKEKISTLENKLGTLKSDVEKTDESKDLDQESAANEKRNEETRLLEKLKYLENEIQTLQNELLAKDESLEKFSLSQCGIENLRQELTLLKEENEKERQSASLDLAKKMEEKNTELQQLREELSTYVNKCNQLESNRALIDDEREDSMAKYNTQQIELQEMKEELLKLRADLSIKTAESATLDELLKVEQENYTEVNAKLLQQTEEHAKLQAVTDELQNAKCGFEEKLEHARIEMQKLSLMQESAGAAASSIESEKLELSKQLQAALKELDMKNLEYNKLSEECSDLKEANENQKSNEIALRGELTTKNEQNAEISKELHSATELVSKLQVDIVELKKQNEISIETKAQVIESIKSAKNDLERQVKELENTASTNENALTTTNKDLSSQIEKLQKALHNCQIELEAERDKNVKQEAITAAKIDELKSTVATLDTTNSWLQKLTQEHENTVERSQELEVQLKNSEQKCGQQELNIGDLSRKLEALNTKCDSLTSQNEILQNDILSARTIGSETQTAMQKLIDELNALKQTHADLQAANQTESLQAANQIEELLQKLKNSAKDIEELKSQNQKTKEELTKKHEQSTAFEEQVIKHELSLSEASRQHENLQQKLNTAVAQNESLQNDLMALRSSSTDSNAELLKLTQTAAEKQSAYEMLVDKTNNERSTLEGQLQSSQHRIDTLCNQIEALTLELKSTAEENFKRTESLKTVQEKHEALALEFSASTRELDMVKSKCESLTNQNSLLQKDLEALRLTSTDANGEVLKLTEELNSKQKAIQILNDDTSATQLKLQNQIQELTQSLDTNQGETQNLRNELETALELSKKQEAEYLSLKAAIQELETVSTNSATEKTQVIIDLEQQLKQAEQTKLTLNDAISSLQNQIKLLQDEILKSQLAFKSREEELLGKVNSTNNDSNQLQKKLSQLETESDSKLTILQNEQQELLQKVEQLTTQLKEKDDQVQQHNTESAQLKISQSNNTEELRKLESEIESLTEKLTLANDEVVYRTEITEADKLKIEELKGMVEAIQEANAGISATNRDLCNALQLMEMEKCEIANIFEIFEIETDKTNEHLSGKVSGLLQQLTEAQKQVTDRDEILENNKKMFQATELERKALILSVSESQAKILEHETTVKEKEQLISTLKAQILEQTEKLIKHEEVEQQLEEYKKVMDELDDESTNSTAKITEMQTQLKNLQAEKIAFTEREKNLNMEYKTLERKIDVIEAEKVKEINALKVRINDLQSIRQLKQNGDMENMTTESDNLEGSTAQINFLNSIIADMQKKNDTLKAKIEALEKLPTDFMQPNAFDLFTKRKPTPRKFCDICDEFDKHETEDCPMQADERDSPTPISEANNNDPAKKERKLPEPRKYCDACEVFGHETGECVDDECY